MGGWRRLARWYLNDQLLEQWGLADVRAGCVPGRLIISFLDADGYRADGAGRDRGPRIRRINRLPPAGGKQQGGGCSWSRRAWRRVMRGSVCCCSDAMEDGEEEADRAGGSGCRLIVEITWMT